MGQVFLALSPGGGRKVAVKLIRPDYARDPRFRERFALEVGAARRVGGFHTAQVIDADPDAEAPWMATAYISGPSLQDVVCGAGPLDPRAVVELGAGLAEGLGAIHACGLVHRDLKPSNVIMADDGPRIIDFGIAQVGNASALTATGAPVGTYAFMSPEQVRGETVGPASDVFSLGCVLAFAARGHGPFDAPNIPAIVRRILEEPPRLDGLADPPRELIAACLAKDPARRPDIAELLRRTGLSSRTRTEVGAAPRAPAPAVPPAAPEPAVPPGPGEPEGPRRPARRIVLLGGVAAASAAVSAMAFWPRDRKEPAKRRDEGAAAPKEPTAGLLKGAVPTVVAAFSPDGRTVAAASFRRATDKKDEEDAGPEAIGDSGCIQLWDVATRRLSTLTKGGSDFLPRALAFSPDGRTLAVGSAGSDSVTLWNMATGRVKATLDRDWGYGYGDWTHTTSLAFSPDGRTLVVCGSNRHLGPDRGYLRLWDLSGPRPVGTARKGGQEDVFYGVAFSPDGRSIAACGDSGVRLWERSSRRGTAIRDPASSVTNAVAFSPDGRTLASCDGFYDKDRTAFGRGGISLWDTATGRATALTQEVVYDVAFGPDGRHLASTGEEGLKVWNVATGRASVLDDRTRYWLALSPDGRTLATSEAMAPNSERTTDIELWKLP
ncbi:protein kinase [Streptomyces sp. TRM68416]|nr:protein kinase [Streptomyces sp. TRM68416]